MEQSSNPESAVIFVAGNSIPYERLPLIPSNSLVIAADGGLNQAESLDIPVDIVIGDMDSVDPETLFRAQLAGIEIHHHPVEKDATDFALALQEVVRQGCTDLLVIGGAGGRLDHFLGNAMLVAAQAKEGIKTTWCTGSAIVAVAHPGSDVTVNGAPGDWVSLIALGGHAAGVTTQGTRWMLDQELLDVGSTRGISNELVSPQARVSVSTGTILVIHTLRNEI